MSIHLIEPADYQSPERVRALVKDARKLRAETVAELFGFGFSALGRVVELVRPADGPRSAKVVGECG
jgi:hypothetical protein